MRVPLIALALVAVPLSLGVAQSSGPTNSNAIANRCKNTPQAGQTGNSQAGAAAVAQAQAAKCSPPAPVPPPPPPPSATGNNSISGMVFEDIDGNGSQDPFAGEMGLSGWSVQLFNSLGQVLSTASTDWSGAYSFGSLPAGSFSVCVVGQGTYQQTAPTSGSGCNGAGYSFNLLQSVYGTNWMNVNFGEMLVSQ